MVRETIVINNPSGLHLRPAARLSETALQFRSRITLENGSVAANAKSVLGILGALVRCGDTVVLICDGPDEEEAMRALRDVLSESGDGVTVRSDSQIIHN